MAQRRSLATIFAARTRPAQEPTTERRWRSTGGRPWHPEPQGGRESRRSGSSDPGQSRPRRLTTRFSGKCRCGAQVERGAEIAYANKKIVGCAACGFAGAGLVRQERNAAVGPLLPSAVYGHRSGRAHRIEVQALRDAGRADQRRARGHELMLDERRPPWGQSKYSQPFSAVVRARGGDWQRAETTVRRAVDSDVRAQAARPWPADVSPEEAQRLADILNEMQRPKSKRRPR